MNIFVLHRHPSKAARMHCDKHVPKMVVELYQQLGSAMRRHGAKDREMPLTQKGTPLKGGYHNHPCTRWVGDSGGNYHWSLLHAKELCREYKFRYGKQHACEDGIYHLGREDMLAKLPRDTHGKMTPFAQAMPDEYRDADAVAAYRRYYIEDKAQNIVFKYERGREMPKWLKEGLTLSVA